MNKKFNEGDNVYHIKTKMYHTYVGCDKCGCEEKKTHLTKYVGSVIINRHETDLGYYCHDIEENTKIFCLYDDLYSLVDEAQAWCDKYNE